MEFSVAEVHEAIAAEMRGTISDPEPDGEFVSAREG